MRRITERPKAQHDLDHIFDYIVSADPDAARRVISAVADTYRHVAEWPEMSNI